MPKIIGYTPSWLSRPSPGARIFSDPEPQSPLSPSKRSSYIQTSGTLSSHTTGPRRIVANRGSEIFTVVGNKIRWADLSKVKDEWEASSQTRKQQDGKEVYRTLVTPVYYQITELSISPSGTFIAICTEHTVHIGVIPDSSRLRDNDYSPLKLKTYQLGPTTHVIPESPLASVLWHPLAASSTSADCLVTITREAAVRMWEVDRANPWSFEKPALAIDLRKLADGVSSDQDFEPSGFGKNRGFSADAFDMEVAAARFGGRASPDEDGWASMTLWTAMSNGDVYALCPLLPTKWRPTATTIPALSISAVSSMSLLDLEKIEKDERRAIEQQYEWIQEIDNEVPVTDDDEYDEIRSRPQNPSAIPRLQGPFEINDLQELEDGEITDLHVIAAQLDEDSILSGEEGYEISNIGAQFTILCLTSTTSQLSVAVELEGVSGQWLPKKDRSTFSVPVSEARDLISLERISLQPARISEDWPMMSIDATNPYGLYVTTSSKIQSISLAEWAGRIGNEVLGEGDEVDSGLHTRLAVACQNQICLVNDVFTAEPRTSMTPLPLSAPAQIQSLEIGQMLVSSMDGEACAALFDDQIISQHSSSLLHADLATSMRSSRFLNQALQDNMPVPVPTRAPYSPADTFYQNQLRPYEELRQKIPTGRRSVMTEKPLRLSPACLDIMTLAHRSFSMQTSNIERAAAELFRRCERLREELSDQVKQMSELADRLQHLKSTSESNEGQPRSFEQRLTLVQDKQKSLTQRYEALRRKTGKIGTTNQELSEKEQIWMDEIDTLARRVGVDTKQDQENIETLSGRYKVVDSLSHDLVEQSKKLVGTEDSPVRGSSLKHSDSPKASLSISSRMQRERVADVMAMVEREGAIIDAVMNRLSKLNVG